MIEDIDPDGGCVGFCEAVDAGGSYDARVYEAEGRGMDRSMAALLVCALRGWLGGPKADAIPTEKAYARGSRGLPGAGDGVDGTRGGTGGVGGSEGTGRAGELGGHGQDQGTEEVVDWVDTKGRVICALPRTIVHEKNILHRGAGVMIRDREVRCV